MATMCILALDARLRRGAHGQRRASAAGADPARRSAAAGDQRARRRARRGRRELRRSSRSRSRPGTGSSSTPTGSSSGPRELIDDGLRAARRASARASRGSRRCARTSSSGSSATSTRATTSRCSSPSGASTKVAHTMKLPVFKIDEREQAGGVVLALSGELDLAGAPELHDGAQPGPGRGPDADRGPDRPRVHRLLGPRRARALQQRRAWRRTTRTPSSPARRRYTAPSCSPGWTRRCRSRRHPPVRNPYVPCGGGRRWAGARSRVLATGGGGGGGGEAHRRGGGDGRGYRPRTATGFEPLRYGIRCFGTRLNRYVTGPNRVIVCGRTPSLRRTVSPEFASRTPAERVDGYERPALSPIT